MKYKSSFLNEANERGFFYQSTNLNAMDEFLATKNKYGYLGFDITAKSLHVGHLITIFLLRLFQKHGHTPIVLVGGGTTKIGDPSFKNTARPILTNDEIAVNLKGIESCLVPFLKFEGKNGAIIVNNDNWLNKLEYIPFLLDIGKYFSINRMVGFESVKAKLTANDSLSFLEFNYMILQAYDFYRLHTEFGCNIQFGGQDQWGNIVCGVELIKKKVGKEVFGFTNPLLTTSDGKKMGKTANGAVWLSKDMLSPYDFWQYWRNVDDADVVKLMYLFTDLEIEEIKKMESIRGQELNQVKELLADEVTTITHGKDSLPAIHQAAEGMFKKSVKNLSLLASIPQYCLKNGINSSIIDIIVESGMCASKSEAKRLIRGGGVYVNGESIMEDYKIPENLSHSDVLKLSCGKKKHLLIRAFASICLFLAMVCAFNNAYTLCCDSVYVINLDRNKERMERMKKQLAKIGIEFKRFKAIDGYSDIKIIDVKLGKVKNNKSFHKTCDKKSKYLIYCDSFSFEYSFDNDRVLCCGEFGCALSHLSIMEDIVKNNYRGAIVFEDDISLKENFKNVLVSTLKSSPKNTDILFLDIGVFYDYSSPYFVSPGKLLNCFSQIPNNKYVVKLDVKSGKAFGMHAYFVTKNGAEKILASAKHLICPIDIHIIKNENLLKYAARKKSIYAAEDKSEIQNMGRNFSVTRNEVIVSKKRN